MLFRITNLVMATNIIIPNSSLFKKFLITNVYKFCVCFVLCVLAFRYPQSRRVSNRGDAFPGFSWRLITSDRVVWSPGSSWGDDSTAGCGAQKHPLPPPGKQFLHTVFRTDEGRAVLYYNSRVFQRTKESLGDCRRSARVSFESGLSVLRLHVTGIASCF